MPARTLKNDPLADIRVNVAAPSLGEVVRKTVTFDGSTGNGEVGTVNLFTVTGAVLVRLFARCTVDLAGATATVAVGISGATTVLITTTTGTNVDAGEIWHDATPDASIEALTVLKEYLISNGNDIILTVATADVTGGEIEFVLFFEPLSADGNVVAA